jgi:putative methionine-R-sulfoxide reductase with GAF domain/HAMP domain-containing protein
MLNRGSLLGSGQEDRSSLAHKVRRAFLSYALVLIVVISGPLIYYSYRAQQDSLALVQQESASRVSQTISSYLQRTIQELLLVEHAHDLAGQNPAAVAEDLERLLSFRNDLFDELALVDGDGREVARVSKFRTYTADDLQSWAGSQAFEATSAGRNFIGSVYLSQFSLPIVTVAVPIRGHSGEMGALMAEVSIRQMWEAVLEVELSASAYAYIVNQDGTLLAHKALASFFAHRHEDMSHVPEVREALAGGAERAPNIYTDFSGQRVTSAHALIDVENIRWVVVVAVPVAEAYAPIYNMLFSLAAIVVLAFVGAGVAGSLLPRAIVRPLILLEEGAAIIGAGNLDHRIEIETGDEIGRLGQAINEMAGQLAVSYGELEARVAARTRALALSAAVSRRLSTILDRNQLVEAVVEQVQEAFDYYHVHIYLLDETNQTLVMAGGTGEAGQQMLARGHSVSVGRGLVGQTAQANLITFVPDISQNPSWLPNPLLPDTKAEVAAPIAIGDRVLGVLDVQHNVPGGLRPEDAELIQAIANQVASALQNAISYEQAQRQAEREALINSISQKVQNTTRMDQAVQVAIRELGRAVGAGKTMVRLRQNAPDGDQS